MKYRISLPSLIVIFILLVFLFFSWFVSSPIRAARIDRYILYYIDESVRYFHAKASLQSPLVFLNPYAKSLTMIFSNLFLHILPFGMISLRIMNALFSAGTLFLLSRLMKKLGFSETLTILAILITATFPPYFLSSFSVLSEPMFSFFLILAIFLYYSNKHLLSSLVVSLTPLIRQEGVIFLCIWLFLLFELKKEKYIFFLFIPTLLWIITNKIFLNHPFSYIFLFLPRIMQGDLPYDSLLNVKDLRLAYFLGYLPILFLFLSGLKIRIRDKKYFLLLICITAEIILIAVLNIFIFLTRKHLVYELRFLIPIIPLVNIYILSALGAIADKYIKKNEISGGFFISAIFIIIFLNFYQLKKLQRLPYVLNNYINPEQEVEIKSASDWIEDYLDKEGIKDVTYRKMTHKIIRRVLMYLPGNMQFYVLGSNNSLNVVTFKLESFPASKAIFFTINDKEDKDTIEKLNLRLIKDFPNIPLYLYLFDNK